MNHLFSKKNIYCEYSPFGSYYKKKKKTSKLIHSLIMVSFWIFLQWDWMIFVGTISG